MCENAREKKKEVNKKEKKFFLSNSLTEKRTLVGD